MVLPFKLAAPRMLLAEKLVVVNWVNAPERLIAVTSRGTVVDAALETPAVPTAAS